MSRSLPARANVEHLKNQAKELLDAMRAGDADAAARFRPFASELETRAPRLTDAQLIVAREYGFASWQKLTEHVESLSEDPVLALVAAVTSNNLVGAKRALDRFPELRSKLNDAIPEDGFGATLLHRAVDRKSTAMIDLLLNAGANIDVKSHWWAGGFSLLETTDVTFAPVLLERGVTMTIHGAARLDRIDDVDRLLAEKPDLVSLRGGDGQTALHFAASVDMARHLLDRGAEIDALCVDHESTPAQWMIRDRQPVARYLVSRGCRTDILMASALGDVDLVRRYLDVDPASVNVAVTNQFFARKNPHAAATIYTWTLGGNKTAHIVARDFGHHDVFDLLMSRSPDSLKLTIASQLGDRGLVDTLLAERPMLATTLSDDERRKIVMMAEANRADAVAVMLGAGWTAGQRGERGQTALHWAGFHGNAEMARELLRHDAPLEVEDATYHATPLGWALHGSMFGWRKDSGDYAGTVEALLQAGAKMPPGSPRVASDAVRVVLRRHRYEA